jgi:putative peptide maturation dehydrogenase
LSRVRRTRYLAFTRVDDKTVDLARLLRGSLELVPVSRTVALSVLTGTQQSLSRAELELALDVPEAWTVREDLLSDRDSADAARLDSLAKKGVLVTDDNSPDLAELRRRDEALAEDHWSPHAALYHYMAKWRDVRVDLDEPEQGESFDELIERAQDEIERLGNPPPHFVDLPNPKAVLSLELPSRSGQLYGGLNRRKTSRGFDREKRVTAEQLATVLAYVWGCHGLADYGQGLAIVKKTSPSGGGLHPIEAYPIVRDVEGVSPGLYHYNVRHHALELMAELEPADVEELALDFTAGQTYFQSAHVLFLMTARFPRSYWKYRDYPRAYGVILMDAGHLSQTLYLVSTDLGLGAFVTAAINGANIEERLGLDGYREGAILICGCGPPGPAPAGLEPSFAPYVPR